MDGPQQSAVASSARVRPAGTLAARLFPIGIGAFIALGIALRVLIWVSPWGVPESDEAVGGLMAQHLLSGGLSVFYWGQGYGGPLEVVLAAPLVAIFGGSWVALRLIPIVLAGVTALVVWRIGLRTMSRYGAITAAAVFWTFPTYLLWKTIHFHIFYGSGLLFGALALLLVLRLRDQPSRRDAVLLGFVVGIGMWQSFQLVAVIPVAIAWLLLRRRDVLRLVPLAAPGVLAGLIPVLISNVRHSWWSFNLGQIGIASSYLSRIGTFFTHTLPMSFDLRAPCTTDWFVHPVVGIALYVGLLAGFVALAWWSRRTNRELLVVVVATFPLIAAINQLTGTFMNPVYVVVLMPVLTLLLCSWISRPIQALWVMGAVLVLLGATFSDLHRSEADGHAKAGCLAPGGYAPRDMGPLIDTLDKLDLRRVYADYWTAYRIDFETRGHIVAAEARSGALAIRPGGAVIPNPDDASLHPRHPQYDAIVAGAYKPAWVIDRDLEGGAVDIQMFKVAGYRSKQVGAFTIYWHGVDSKGAAP